MANRVTIRSRWRKPIAVVPSKEATKVDSKPGQQVEKELSYIFTLLKWDILWGRFSWENSLTKCSVRGIPFYMLWPSPQTGSGPMTLIGGKSNDSSPYNLRTTEKTLRKASHSPGVGVFQQSWRYTVSQFCLPCRFLMMDGILEFRPILLTGIIEHQGDKLTKKLLCHDALKSVDVTLVPQLYPYSGGCKIYKMHYFLNNMYTR